jgi:hypothetical protein
MKSKTFKRFLTIYGIIAFLLVIMSTCITIFGGYVLIKLLNSSFAIMSAGLLGILLSGIVIAGFNNTISKAYDKKLRDDAYDMAQKIKKNNVGENPHIVDELIAEIVAQGATSMNNVDKMSDENSGA